MAMTKSAPSPLRAPKRLSQLLNFRLQVLFALSGAPVVRMLEGRHGITRREWRLLARLAETGPLSPSALAEAAQLDRARTSRAIGLLTAKNLVSRTPEARDPRRAVVTITASGLELYARIFPDVAQLNAQLVDVLDDEQLRVLDGALERMTAQARLLNQQVATEIKALRQAGGSRRLHPNEA